MLDVTDDHQASVADVKAYQERVRSLIWLSCGILFGTGYAVSNTSDLRKAQESSRLFRYKQHRQLLLEIYDDLATWGRRVFLMLSLES